MNYTMPFQIVIGSDVFTLEQSSFKITQLVTKVVPPSKDGNNRYIVWCTILLGVVMITLIMAWVHQKYTRTMKIHSKEDKHFTSEKTIGQQVNLNQWFRRTLVMLNLCQKFTTKVDQKHGDHKQ